MKNLFIIASLFFSATLLAQNSTRDWRACFDNGRRLAPRTPLQASATDSADNLFIAGFVNLYHDLINDSIYLRKYNAAGILLWEIYEPFKTTSAWPGTTPLTVAVDKNGNVIIGYSYSYVSSNIDAVVSKYSTAGKKLWQTVFDGPEEIDNEQTKKLNIDDKGNIYLLIAENNNDDYTAYGITAKFNGKGKLLWYRDMRGIYDYQVNDATIDSSGNVYVTGFSGRLPRGYYYDVITYKFFTNGDSVWSRRHNFNFSSYGYRVMYAKKDNSVLVCGHLTNQNGTPDSIIALKYSAAGKLLWSYEGKPSRYQTFNQSVIDADNNILIASSQTVGPDYSAPFLTKLSPSGTLIGSKYAFKGVSIPVPYIAYDLKTDAQRNYYIIVNQSMGVLIQKFDKDGNLLAQKTESFDTSLTVYYAGLNIGKNQSIYAATCYGYYFARTNTCISRYALQNATAVTNNMLYDGKSVMKLITGNTNTIFPNPAHDIIHLPASVIQGFPYTICVFNALGQQVLLTQCSASQNTIDISRLANGAYVIKMMVNAVPYFYRFIKIE